MSLQLSLFFGLVLVLLLLLAWALRAPRKPKRPGVGPNFLEETGRRHVDFLPQIRQALAHSDYDFLADRGMSSLQRRLRRERKRIVLAYLAAVREDFESLLRMAKIIYVLSPEVAALHKFERLRLPLKFSLRYRLIRMQLRAGKVPIPRLAGLSDLVSGLSVRMETAMKELGERAALAAELASSFDGRGSDVA